MEEFRSCPICFEVPEKEIYQCSAGHVICDSCVLKVRRCSQCRVDFGVSKIRNRALEKILDTQVFACKFKDKGCPLLCQRRELTNHANFCLFNADTVPLCEQMGYKDCKFRMGSVSKSEIISHFQDAHNCAFKPYYTPNSSIFKVSGYELMNRLTQKKKLDALDTPPVVLFGLVNSSDFGLAPLVLAKGDHSSGFLSLVCVKIWESSSQPPTTTTAEFILFKNPPVSSTQGKSSSSSHLKTGTSPFPLGGIMNVGGVKEAHELFKASPINIPISLLEKSRFGSDMGDVMKVEINEKIAAVARGEGDGPTVRSTTLSRSELDRIVSQNMRSYQVSRLLRNTLLLN